MKKPTTPSLRQRVKELAVGEKMEVSAELHNRSVIKQTAYNIAQDLGRKYRTTVTAQGMIITRVS